MMDTFVEQQWYGENAELAYSEIEKMLNHCEELFSAYKEGSEIYALNQKSGESPTPISPITMELLERSLAFSRESDGVFDITVAPLVKLWNVTGDNPKVPQIHDIDACKTLISYKNLSLNKKNPPPF